MRSASPLGLVVFLTSLLLSEVHRATATQAAASSDAARKTIRAAITQSRFQEALTSAEKALRTSPDDPELERLRGYAVVGLALQREETVALAWKELLVLGRLASTLNRLEEEAFVDARPLATLAAKNSGKRFSEAVEQSNQSWEQLKYVSTRLSPFAHRGPNSIKTRLLAAWADAVCRVAQRHVAGIQREAGKLDPVTSQTVQKELARLSSRESIDEKQLMRRAVSMLRSSSATPANDAQTVLAIAEWLEMSFGDPANDAPSLSALRRFKFCGGMVGIPGERDKQALAEYVTLGALDAADLDQVSPRHIIPLFRRAAELDQRDRLGGAYSWYVQCVPADTAAGLGILKGIADREPGNALAELEFARLSAVVDVNPTDMLEHLRRAASHSKLSRKLFVTIPGEFRKELLAVRLVTGQTDSNDFGFDFLRPAFSQLVRATPDPAQQRTLLGLEASLGSLLMKSDYPQDWVSGAGARAEALAAFRRLPGVEPDVIARVDLEIDQLSAQLHARKLPADVATFAEGKIRVGPAIPDGRKVMGPSVVVLQGGPTIVGQ